MVKAETTSHLTSDSGSVILQCNAELYRMGISWTLAEDEEVCLFYLLYTVFLLACKLASPNDGPVGMYGN